MLKVMYNPKWCEDSPIEHAFRYSDEQFSELSKVWADLGLELLVHKQEVDPMIDIIQRDEDGLIVYAMTIRVGDWFTVDPADNEWYVVPNKELTERYIVVEEEAPNVQA